MRYIGNKTRLLGFIGRVLRARGISRGIAVDPFSGTASVARSLKRRGFHVIAADIMDYAYVFARAYVQVSTTPDFRALSRTLGIRSAALPDIVAAINRIAPAPGFIHSHYTPQGSAGRSHGRMYFTPENGARIDALRVAFEEWRSEKIIDDDAFHVLLAALLEAADRVANTTGVYAAYVKSWQSNARRPLEMRTPRLIHGNGCHAHRGDALELIRGLNSFDLLYLDPPYNSRQYAGYYHVPEIIANGWFQGPVRTRGKTGLLDDEAKRSDWSRSRRCEQVFEALVAAARCRHILMSYNAEGIIPEATIERVFRHCGKPDTYRRYVTTYRRYRSDADGENRRYSGDSVQEYLYCVEKAEG